MFDLFAYHDFTATYKVKDKTFKSLAEAENYAREVAEKEDKCVIYKNGVANSYVKKINGHIEVRKIKINY